MRKRIGIYGVTEEVLNLIPLLTANPGLEIVRTFDDDPEGMRLRLEHADPGVATLVLQTFADDAAELASDASLTAVIGADPDSDFNERFPEAAERGVQVVTPLAARMLWGYATSAPSAPRPTALPPEPGERGAPAQTPPPPPRDERKAELLQALHEVVESYNLTIDTDELFIRMLEIALGVTDADGGSLMLVDPESGDLRIRVAVGIEPELWPKIRLRPGEGIAGRVAEEGRPLHLRGRADRQRFRIVRERLDVESALCVPLIHQDRVLGVLNIHASVRPDAFSEDDLEFVQELAHLDAQIIARAQEHEILRSQAQRYEAVREVREIMTGRDPLPDRLDALCHFVADRVSTGIATMYEVDHDDGLLRLAASSLRGASPDLRVPMGQGIDGGAAAARRPAFLWQPNAGFYAALPLTAGGTLAGLLTIQAGIETPRGRVFEDTLREIADAVAEELVHAQRESRISERANKAAAINEAGIRMISTTDPGEVLRLGTSEATLVLDADHAVLRLQDEETRRFVIRSYFGSAEGHLQEQLFRLDKLVSVDVLKRRGPLLIPQLHKEPQFANAGFDARSLIAAPLRQDGQIIGNARRLRQDRGRSYPPGCLRPGGRRALHQIPGLSRASCHQRTLLLEGAAVSELRRGHGAPQCELSRQARAGRNRPSRDPPRRAGPGDRAHRESRRDRPAGRPGQDTADRQVHCRCPSGPQSKLRCRGPHGRERIHGAASRSRTFSERPGLRVGARGRRGCLEGRAAERPCADLSRIRPCDVPGRRQHSRRADRQGPQAPHSDGLKSAD